MFESVNRDTKMEFLTRALRLLTAWEESEILISCESFISELNMFMYQATR